jgi:hypothetical protein
VGSSAVIVSSSLSSQPGCARRDGAGRIYRLLVMVSTEMQDLLTAGDTRGFS